MAGEIPDSLALALSTPVELGAITYDTLNLSEPTVAQLRKAAKAGDGMDQLATLIHLNAAVPMAVVDKLKQRDFEAAGSFFARFGATSTPPESAT